MCTSSCIQFGESHLFPEEITNKRVLEVGAINVNGSLRWFICNFEPMSYLGVDITSGPGVDEICDINDLINRYGKDNFDLVICTEVLEHVRNWPNAVSNLKNILKPKGKLLLTTRSRGFPYHSYPFDFWRYEAEDMNEIFGDLVIEANEKDHEMPGVFFKACKPIAFAEKNLDDINLYSIIRRKRCRGINEFYIFVFKVKRAVRQVISLILPEATKATIKKLLLNKLDA